MTRLNGLTCAPSTADAGVEAWMRSWAGSPVPIYQWRGNERESKEAHPGSGGSSRESYAKFSADPANPARGKDSFLLKTSRQLSLWTLMIPDADPDQPYSENLTPSGSMRNGYLYSRPTLALPKIGSESLSWPTAKAVTGGPNSNRENRENTGEPDLQEVTRQWSSPNWPTAMAEDSESPGGKPSGYRSLSSSSRACSTPNVPNGGRTLSPEDVANRGATDKGKRQVGLEMEAKHWSTPHGNGNPTAGCGGGEFAKQIKNWAGSQTRDTRSGETLTDYGNSRPLNEQVMAFSRPDKAPGVPATQSPAKKVFSPAGSRVLTVERFESLRTEMLRRGAKLYESRLGLRLRLNPAFVNWHQGNPWFWTRTAPTSSAPSEIRLWLSKVRSRFESLSGERDCLRPTAELAAQPTEAQARWLRPAIIHAKGKL